MQLFNGLWGLSKSSLIFLKLKLIVLYTPKNYIHPWTMKLCLFFFLTNPIPPWNQRWSDFWNNIAIDKFSIDIFRARVKKIGWKYQKLVVDIWKFSLLNSKDHHCIECWQLSIKSGSSVTINKINLEKWPSKWKF